MKGLPRKNPVKSRGKSGYITRSRLQDLALCHAYTHPPENVDGHGDGAKGHKGEADDEHVEEVPAVGKEGPGSAKLGWRGVGHSQAEAPDTGIARLQGEERK